MTTSRIPAALDAIYAVCAAGLGDASVILGPPLSWDDIQVERGGMSETRYLFVGASPSSDSSVEGSQDFNAAGAVSRNETFTVYLTVYTRSGDGDVGARRDEAFALLAVAESALKADPSLSGAVLYSRVSAISRVAFRQTNGGSDCIVEFQVACRAYLN